MPKSKSASQRVIPPSRDVRDEALRSARALTDGLFPTKSKASPSSSSAGAPCSPTTWGSARPASPSPRSRRRRPNGPYLVVVPASVKRNWEREILAARPNARVAIVGPNAAPKHGFDGWVIVNYDILAKDIDSLEKHAWAGLMFDEAHYLKNHTRQRSKLARSLVESGPDAVLHALTGTPLTNRHARRCGERRGRCRSAASRGLAGDGGERGVGGAAHDS